MIDNNSTENAPAETEELSEGKDYTADSSEGTVTSAGKAVQGKNYAKTHGELSTSEVSIEGALSEDSCCPKVALVRCESYEEGEVYAAMARAIELLGGFQAVFPKHISKDSKLLLKPNLLSKAHPDKAVTTHPAVFGAAGKALQEAGYRNLKYGDSPGNPIIKVEKLAEECGLKEKADSLNIPLGDFEQGVSVNFPQGKAADKFVLCKEVPEADGIVNLCKMKTHQLERITGAVKNTFGCVYGFNKGSAHAMFATAEVFGRMIADLNRLVKPVLHIMDGVVAMEGNGPASGNPKKMELILASADPVALDGLFCHLINLKPELVPTNVSAMEQGVGSYENIQVLTDKGIISCEEAALIYGDKNFNVQRSREYRGALKPVRFLAPFLEKKPVVKAENCIGCGLCVKVCPVDGKAIEITEAGETTVTGAESFGGTESVGGSGRKRRGVAVYRYDKCIKCYCCQEMCPEKAITVRKSLLAKIADRHWRI